jgi:hypothetical protein
LGVLAGLELEISNLFGNNCRFIKMDGRWRANDGTLHVKAKVAVIAAIIW